MQMYVNHEDEIVKALAKDLHKSRQESIINEVELLRNDLRNLLMNFRDYAKPEKVRVTVHVLKTIFCNEIFLGISQPEKTFVNMLDDVIIHKDPYGLVLVIGAWNYPIQLTLLPVAAAIAAGNTVIIKPSEVAPASAQFIADYIPKYLDNVRSLI